MAINGASRMVQAQNQINREAQSGLNADFKNENDKVKGIKKFPSRSAKEHNHSK